MSNVKVCGSTCGYINALIGGFILIIQGILTMIAEAPAASSLSIVGGVSFLSFTGLLWLNGLIMLLLGILVLFLVWPWLQQQSRTGPWIKDQTWIGILLIILGFVAGGTGGIFALVAGILYIIGQLK